MKRLAVCLSLLCLCAFAADNKRWLEMCDQGFDYCQLAWGLGESAANKLADDPLRATWAGLLADTTAPAQTTWTLDGEMHCVSALLPPENNAESNNAKAELDWFKARGFDTMLAVWPGTGKNLGRFANVIAYAKEKGWRVGFAMGGDGWMQGGTYFDPADLSTILDACGDKIDFTLVGWHGAGQSHWMQGRVAWQRAVARMLQAKLGNAIPLLNSAAFDGDAVYAAPAAAFAGYVVTTSSGIGSVNLPGVAAKLEAAGCAAPFFLVTTGEPPLYRTFASMSPLPTTARVLESEGVVWAAVQAHADKWRGLIFICGDSTGELPNSIHTTYSNSDSLTKSHYRP